LTVVLPLLPTTIASGMSKRERQSDAIVGHQRGGRALRQRGRHEVVPVEALAAQRDEEIAGTQAAAVGGHAQEARVGSDGAAGHDAGGGHGVHHAALQSASAACASRASSNGVRAPLRSW
jgi:hypothetical protein